MKNLTKLWNGQMGIVESQSKIKTATIKDHLEKSHHIKFEPKPTLFGFPYCKMIKTLTHFFLLLKTPFPCFFFFLLSLFFLAAAPNLTQLSFCDLFLFSFFYIQTMGFAHWSSPHKGADPTNLLLSLMSWAQLGPLSTYKLPASP